MLKNPASVWMAPPVNKPGHQPDVTVLIVTKETNARSVLTGSREMVVLNVLMVTMATHVVSRFQLRFVMSEVTSLVFWGLKLNQYLTSMHYSRMRTARWLTVFRGGVCISGGFARPGDLPKSGAVCPTPGGLPNPGGSTYRGVCLRGPAFRTGTGLHLRGSA